MTPEEKKEKARQRAEVIWAVQKGQITAVEGAIRLGVSRKTYYKWEARALVGMAQALEDEACGRPEKPMDQEKEKLQQRVNVLEKEVETAKQSEVVRNMLSLYEERLKAKAGRKKNGS